MQMANFDHATVVASGSGRLRIAVPRLYRSRRLKAEIEREWGRRAGVVAVYANTLSARVLILFDAALPAGALLADLGIAPPLSDPPHDRAPATAAPAAAPRPVNPAALYPPWHLREAGTAMDFLRSSRNLGLSHSEAGERLRRGANLLTRQQRSSSLAILLNQFRSLPVLLLGVSALLSVATGGLAEAAAIMAVLALNGGIGFATERSAESTIASLSELIDDIVPVLRDGGIERIEASHVVPGDVLALAPGIRVAADVRLLQADDLTVDESALTGESVPRAKHSDVLRRPAPLAERDNMAYRGSAVASGSGLGLVVGTGDRTEVGAIQALTGSTRRPRTPVQIQLDALGRRLASVSAALCVGLFGLGLLRGFDRLQMLKTAISLAVAALPESLPAVATSALARGVRRMRAQQVLMRRLHAVETIGAIQTICLDKTGTLTLNRMTAVALHTSTQAWHVEGGRPVRPAPATPSAAELERLLQIGVLCNLSATGSGHAAAAPNGSATENALIELAAGAGMRADEVRRRYPLLKMALRAEGRNYMRTLHATAQAGRRLVAVKGNPSEVLALCTHYLSGRQARPLDGAAIAAIGRANDAMAKRQLRVLGFAYAEPDASEAGPDSAGLVWTGLVGLADPLRPGVAKVIAGFHRAGIRTVMLTGDQAATAYVIGKSLHLNNGDVLNIVNSEHLEQIGAERLPALAGQAHIFSRVSPSHKLQIVRALQHGGKIIAMTGDGINDSPALRAADIGIAMGGGTDLALSVADVVLKDDELDTLLEAVRQGRTISHNIGKTLHFLLSSNLSEILLVSATVALGSGPPLTPLQLLWINLLSDMLPAIALVAEPAEDDVMLQAPRTPRQPIVGKQQLWRYAREGGVLTGGALGAYLYGSLRHGPGPQAGTMAFNALLLAQLLHALACRSDRQPALFNRLQPNRQLALAVGGSIALQLLVNVVPGLRRLLGISALGPMDVLVTLAGAGLPLLVNEMGKREMGKRSALIQC